MAIEFEIKKKIGVISEKGSGWNKELNLISWSGKDAKFDIRDWNEEHDKMGKGVTLTEGELVSLYELLSKHINGDKLDFSRE